MKPGNIVLIAAGAGVVQYRFRARVDKVASSENLRCACWHGRRHLKAMKGHFSGSRRLHGSVADASAKFWKIRARDDFGHIGRGQDVLLERWLIAGRNIVQVMLADRFCRKLTDKFIKGAFKNHVGSCRVGQLGQRMM